MLAVSTLVRYSTEKGVLHSNDSSFYIKFHGIINELLCLYMRQNGLVTLQRPQADFRPICVIYT